MRNQNKLAKMEENARNKAIKDYKYFWSQFSREELFKILDKDPLVNEKLDQLGFKRIFRAYLLALTDEELILQVAKIDAAIKEIYPEESITLDETMKFMDR